MFYSFSALADFAFFMPFTFWPSLMLGLGIDLKSSSYVMGVVGISDMIGRVSLGRLVDRYCEQNKGAN